MDAHEYQFILGTSGSPDYLVIAQNHNVVLGIKPLARLLPHPANGAPILFLGLRVRSVFGGKANTVVSGNITQMPTALTFESAWPEIDFVKSDDSRASTEFYVPLDAYIGQRGRMLSAAQGEGTNTLVNTLLRFVPASQRVVEVDDIRTWVTNKMVEDISTLPDQNGETGDSLLLNDKALALKDLKSWAIGIKNMTKTEAAMPVQDQYTAGDDNVINLNPSDTE